MPQIENQVCRRYRLDLSAQDCYDRVNALLEKFYSRPRQQTAREIYAKDSRGKLQKYSSDSRIEDLVMLSQKAKLGESKLSAEEKKILESWIAMKQKSPNTSAPKNKEKKDRDR